MEDFGEVFTFLVIGYLFYWFLYHFIPKQNREIQEEERKQALEGKRIKKKEEVLLSLDELRKKKQKQEQVEKKVKKTGYILRKYKNYIDSFCKIAEREVSGFDEWGDENWDVLPQIKKECIIRIAMHKYRKKHGKPAAREEITDKHFSSYHKNTVKLNWNAPGWSKTLFETELDSIFLRYHEKKRKKFSSIKLDFDKMSGIEFENYIGKLLSSMDFNVSGTPKTGDQGADLVLEKDKKTYVVQLKRYSKPVGNKAVQEVVASKAYYHGDVAVVVTNSTFTPAAKKLAKKNGVVLVKGKHIQKIGSLL